MIQTDLAELDNTSSNNLNEQAIVAAEIESNKKLTNNSSQLLITEVNNKQQQVDKWTNNLHKDSTSSKNQVAPIEPISVFTIDNFSCLTDANVDASIFLETVIRKEPLNAEPQPNSVFVEKHPLSEEIWNMSKKEREERKLLKNVDSISAENTAKDFVTAHPATSSAKAIENKDTERIDEEYLNELKVANEIFKNNKSKNKSKSKFQETSKKLLYTTSEVSSGNSKRQKKRTEQPVAINSNQRQYIIEYPYKLIKHQTESNNKLSDFIQISFAFLINLLFMPIVLVCIIVSCPTKFLFYILFRFFHLCHLSKASYLSPHKVPEFLKPVELFWLYNSNLNRDFLKNKNKKANDSQQMLYTSSGFRSTSACLFFLEGNLPRRTLKDLIHSRIIQANVRSGNGLFDRFTQRLLNLSVFGYVWVDCAEFNLDEHIIEPTDSISLKTNAELQAYTNKLIKEHKFRLDLPLWSIYYIKNFGQCEKSTVVLFIFHQCFSDGLSLIRLFFKGVVDNRNAIEIKSRFASVDFKLSFLKQFFSGWSKIAYFLCCKFQDRNPLQADHYKDKAYKKLNLTAAESNAQDSNEVIVWSEPFDILLLNRLKVITRTKMNDLLISIVAGIVRNYLQLKGVNNPKKMHCVMPIDMSSNKYPFKLGNKSSLISFSIPVNVEGCVPRLWFTKSTMNSLKDSGDYLFIYFLINCLFFWLPNKLAFRLCSSVLDKNSIIASTLGAGDSSLSTVSVCNQNVKSIIFFYPSVANVSLSFSLITYGEEVRLALVADSNIITNPEIITSEFNKQLNILTELLANRRVPGEVRMRVYRASIPSPSGNLTIPRAEYMTDELSVEEVFKMQHRMNEIQHELQGITENLEHLKPDSVDFPKQRQSIIIKSESLKKEFLENLTKLQIRQSVSSHSLPSDDEDEMEPEEIVRLRSASIASKSSISSNRKHVKDSFSEYSSPIVDRSGASRKQSTSGVSKHEVTSYASGTSNNIEHGVINSHIENETTFTQKNGNLLQIHHVHHINNNINVHQKTSLSLTQLRSTDY